MKPYSLVLIAAVVLSACAGPSTEKQAEDSVATGTPAAVTASAADISTYVGDVDEQIGQHYRMLAVHNYLRGDDAAGIVGVFNDHNQPLRLYIYPEGKQVGNQTETWLYLDSLTGKTVLLREIVVDKDKVTEHSFYFGDNTLLQAETRTAKDLTELEEAEFTPYQSAESATDYRLKPATVDSLAKEVIRVVEADRKDLSKEANYVRKQGAAYWATGNEPGWSIAVIPNKKILFNFNYGENKYEFPCSDAQKGDRSSTEFNSKIEGHTLVAKFEDKRCTDDADITHPMTVTITFDGKTYRGCGQSLY